MDELMDSLRIFEQNTPGIEVMEPISDADELTALLDALKEEWGIEEESED